MRMKVWVERLRGTVKFTTDDYAGPTKDWTLVGYADVPLYDADGVEKPKAE